MRHVYADKLYHALERLTEERDPLYRLYYMGWSERILAWKLGVSQAAVHKRKEKVLMQLRKWVNIENYISSQFVTLAIRMRKAKATRRVRGNCLRNMDSVK